MIESFFIITHSAMLFRLLNIAHCQENRLNLALLYFKANSPSTNFFFIAWSKMAIVIWLSSVRTLSYIFHTLKISAETLGLSQSSDVFVFEQVCQ